MSKNVLLTGGTGFIGKNLTQLLLQQGYSISILSRLDKKNTSSITYYKWDLTSSYIDEEAVLKADYIIHLAGEGIVEKRWTTERKKNILNSRIDPIMLLFSILKKHNKNLDAFISASAIGIYGAITTEETCTEETVPYTDYLGQTCQKWESAVDNIAALGIRTVKIRTGIVLGKNEGFLKKIAPAFKIGFGTIIGSGKQYLPWIHISDLCGIYSKALKDTQINGAYNAVAPTNVNYTGFAKTLAHLYQHNIWLPKIPAFLLRIILGEMSVAILTGQKVSSNKIQKAGFTFQYSELKKALSNCLK